MISGTAMPSGRRCASCASLTGSALAKTMASAMRIASDEMQPFGRVEGLHAPRPKTE